MAPDRTAMPQWPSASAEQFHALARRIIDEADAARSMFRRPSTKTNVTLGLMRTLDVPRTIALLKPLTARGDITLRLVDSDERADARIIAKSMLRADEHFVALWSERYVAALPPSHPLALKEKLRTADLAGVPLIDRCHCEQSAFFGRDPQARREIEVEVKREVGVAYRASVSLPDALKDLVGKLQKQKQKEKEKQKPARSMRRP
ncbi:hypothetical protein [Bradyrhizobium sp. WSM471]